jgi:hypothetical protein
VVLDKGLGDQGSGAEVKDALRQPADFLVEQGPGEHRGQRVVVARNLLATLHGREPAQAAKDIAAETGLEHRSEADGRRVAGIFTCVALRGAASIRICRRVRPP